VTIKEQILELRAQGKSYRQIEKELGCARSTISYYLGDNQKEKAVHRGGRYRAFIARYIKTYKEITPCADCGDCFPYYVMDFDHLGDKSFAISRYKTVTNSLERVREEIAKCELVCSNCHRVRTHLRAQAKRENTKKK
jgi:hypothetical protein